MNPERPESENWESWENRLSRIEADAHRLLEAAADLRRDRERERESDVALRSEYTTLREAVVRYAVACGAVDVQLAMMRARPGDGREIAGMENLRRAMEEQNEASNAIRSLARALQQGGLEETA